MRRSPAGLTCVAAVVVAGVLCSSCGVPIDGATRPISADRLPQELRSPPTSPDTLPPPLAPEQGAPSTAGAVYFLDPDLELRSVALPGTVPSSDVDASATAVLRRLAAGPDQDELDDGLQSAVGPGATLVLSGVVDGVATVQASDLARDQSADRLPLAVAQVVLSLTSLPAVEGVRLQRDGVDLDVPLPGGALTSGPLTAQDYSALAVAR